MYVVFLEVSPCILQVTNVYEQFLIVVCTYVIYIGSSSSSSYGSTAQFRPCLPLWGFVTITSLHGWIVSPAPNPQPGGPGSVLMILRDRVAQLYPQALGTYFSRLLRRAWVTVGLFFNPGHHTGHTHRIHHLKRNSKTIT
jgi:hypothetical protein